jgi:hypothetical protein
MFKVTNSGSSIRATIRDHVKMTARATPTSAPRQKPPRISAAVTAVLETQAYLAEPSVDSAASGEGKTNFGTLKTSTSSCQSPITKACTTRTIANDLAERFPSAGKSGSRKRRCRVTARQKPSAIPSRFQPVG